MRPRASGAPFTWTAGFPVDVWRTDDEVVVIGDFPGYAKDRIEIEVERDGLLIRADRDDADSLSAQLRELQRERVSGVVSRRIVLPTPLNEAAIQAELDKGVLTVRIPLASGTRSHRVDIKR